MEKVPPLRRKARDWSQVDPTSLTAALGWDRMLELAPAGVMQEAQEGPEEDTKMHIKAGSRNNKADQERIDTIHDLGLELQALAEELGAATGEEEEEEAQGPEAAAKGAQGPEAPMVYALGGALKAIEPGNPYKLRGPGVIRGGRDLIGDEFGPDTDHGFTRSPIGMPVYYDHAQRGIKSQIGMVTAYEDAEDAIYFEIELDRRKKYIDEVIKLDQEKALALSSGAVGHLVVRKDGHLKRWIIGELSITPTPMEPRTYAHGVKTSPEAQPEADGESAAGAAALDAMIIIIV